MPFLPVDCNLDSGLANISSSLSSFVLSLKYTGFIHCQFYLCLFKIHKAGRVSGICEASDACHSSYSQDSDIAQGRCWHCCSGVLSLWKEVAPRQVMLDPTCLSASSHAIPQLYILWLCFRNLLLIVLESLSPRWQRLFPINFNHGSEFQNRSWRFVDVSVPFYDIQFS